MNLSIDLNADLGESSGHDAELFDLISSANIATGFHAGDSDTIHAAISAAKKQRVAVGAHPSFFDRENFGRKELTIPAEEVFDAVTYQLGIFRAIASALDVQPNHVKPHGALYNMAVRDANLADWIDSHYLPGRLWDKTRDPEGLLSTMPAIGTCLLGVLAGLLLKDRRLTPTQKSIWLISSGVVMIFAGYLWGLQFPVIKLIWTSSFVLVTGGYSAILLGVMHQTIDVWRWKAWATIFVWIGANAIAVQTKNNVTRRVPNRSISTPTWIERNTASSERPPDQHADLTRSHPERETV